MGPRRIVIAGFLVVGLLSPGMPAQAKLCGDSVNGADVPCACGDIVAGDVVLNDDPVTAGPCPGIGLIVRARGLRRPAVVDLHGATLHGSGRAAGLLVLDGGRGGARIVSTGGSATLEGFANGIVAHGRNSVNLVDGLRIVAPRWDGVRVSAATGYRIRDVEVHGAGRHGFSLSGREFRVQRTLAAESGRTGYVVKGKGATLGAPGAGVSAAGSRAAAFDVSGSGHRIVDCVAEGSGEDGVRLAGSRHVVRGCRALRNRGDGIHGQAANSRMTGNRADGNSGRGIAVRGRYLLDQGDNAASDNGGGPAGRDRHIARAAHGAVPCRIGGQPCAR